MNKAIFWDFDGTLVYSKPFSISVQSALKFFSYNVDILSIRSHLHSGFPWQSPEKDYTTITGYKWWEYMFLHFDKLYQKLNVVESANEINKKVRELVLRYQDYVVYEDTLATLNACVKKGFNNYILSNNFPELSDIITGLSLSDFFNCYIVSGQVGYDKPRKEIFEYAYKVANQPDVCYMVGDNPIADIQGGKNFGMTTVMVHNHAPCEADYFIQDLHDLIAFLR